MEYDFEQIGKSIKEERKKNGWTQEELGKMLCISGKQISNVFIPLAQPNGCTNS